MHPGVLQDFLKFIVGPEGDVDYMYLCKNGWVTTLIGIKIDPINLAYSYDWKIIDSKGRLGRSATKDEITKAWKRVKSLQHLKLKGGTFFAKETNLRLPPSERNKKFKRKAMQTEYGLKKVYPKWDTFPSEAQFALMIHAWAWGPYIQNNPRRREFHKACLNQDWVNAAKHCPWPTSKVRIQKMQQLFTAAAKKKNLRPVRN